MKILEQLDDLNLDAAAKTQVTALIQALLDQVKKDAETIEAYITTSSPKTSKFRPSSWNWRICAEFAMA